MSVPKIALFSPVVCSRRVAHLLTQGVVRIENLLDPTVHIPEVMRRVKREYLCKTYDIEAWDDHMDFLAQIA